MMGSVKKRLLVSGLLAIITVFTASPRVRSTDSTVRPANIKRLVTNQKVVALTYDDGPDPRFTPKLLDTLDKCGVKATFFVVGARVECYPDIARDIVRRGHAIANHTYTHPANTWTNSPQQVNYELDTCEMMLAKYVGRRPMFFRPPRGHINASLEAAIAKRGYRTVLWTVCADNHTAPTPQLMADRVVNAIKPGAIILAHDGGFATRWKDIEATPLIVTALKKQGYKFVTIPELLAPKSQPKAKT